MNWYHTGTVTTRTYPDWPYATPGGEFAIRKVHAIRPVDGEPSQLELICDGSDYTPPNGDKIVLSRNIIYHDQKGSILLPAQSPMTIWGGTAGKIDDRYQTIQPSTYRVSAGRKIIGGASIKVDEKTTVLHMNFYREGKTPRGHIAAYVKAANAWIKAGFCFDHGGMHDQVAFLIRDFGLPAVEYLRLQEWEFFSTVEWDPRKVVISNANEILWDGNILDRGHEWPSYKTWFKTFVYPEMRRHFPHHTLAFGLGNGDSCIGISAVDWWPNDTNTMLVIHGYLDPGWYPFNIDGTSVEPIEKILDVIERNRKRLGITNIYWQEFGIRERAKNRNERLALFRKAILQRGYYACAWGADTSYDSYSVATKQNGIWTPVSDPPPLKGSTLKYGSDHEGGSRWRESDTNRMRSSPS